MQNFKKAFTMIELIFVIVVLGILASVALPRFAGTVNQADIASARADVATIRSAIVNERQTQLVRGVNTYIDKLSTAAGPNLFTGSNDSNRTLLMYGIAPGNWARTNDTTYTMTIDGTAVTFTYSVANGTFSCDVTAGTQAQKDLCRKLIN